MLIQIVGFKCHIDLKYNFEHNEITLLKGPSGVGKSTILQSIYWCLYGNMRGIYNNAGITKKLSVTLFLTKFTIHRKKNPELLQVSIINDNDVEQTFEDTIAQELINNKFGTKDLWRACSYIEQKSRCVLISGSSKERMNLLNSLSFTSENPKEDIKKISEELKEVNQNFLLKQQELKTETNIYQEEIIQNPITENMLSVDNLKNSIIMLTNKEKELQQNFIEQERIVGSFNYLTIQISTLTSKLNSLMSSEVKQISYEKYTKDKSKYQDLIKNLDILIPKLETQIKINIKIEELEKQLHNILLPTNFKDIKEITPEEIWAIKLNEENRNKYIKKCEQIGLEYDENSIKTDELSSRLTSLTHLRSHINNYNKLIILEQKIKQLDHLNPTKIQKLEQSNQERIIQISDLKKGLELLSCPKCDESLRYTGKNLIIGDRPPSSLVEISEVELEYKNTKDTIFKMRELISLQENFNVIQTTLLDVSVEELKNTSNIPQEIIKLTKLIDILSTIKYIELPIIDSNTLKNVYNYRLLSQQINELIKQRENIDGNYEESKKLLEMYSNSLLLLEKDYKDFQYKSTGLENITGALSQHKKEILEIEPKLNIKIKLEYEECKKLLKETQLNLDIAEWTNKCKNKEISLKIKSDAVSKLHKDVTGLERLKQKAVEIECKQLEETVENINNVLEITLPIFFPDSINMKLLLFKTLKNKKQIKPGLNLEINYKGVKYENINFLSGGEGDRLSLALLLALNSVSNSPIIMLDECVSSLDPNLKERCIEAIKNIPDKTIICVDHEGVEGFYDSVIEL